MRSVKTARLRLPQEESLSDLTRSTPTVLNPTTSWKRTMQSPQYTSSSHQRLHGHSTVISSVLLTLTFLTCVPCEAALLLPTTSLHSLGKNVTASCSQAACAPPAWNETTCSTQGVCSLSCPTRTDFPNTQVGFLFISLDKVLIKITKTL